MAARNPNAWLARELPAEEIRDVRPGNRMVSYPYTKLIDLEHRGGPGRCRCCSARARPRSATASQRERRVYLRGATEMHHVVHLSEREKLYHHPGMRLAGQRVLERTDTAPDDFACVDVYSCFPFAVQAGAEALGMSEDAELSVTGGLTFGGGPLANYVVQVHRAQRGAAARAARQPRRSGVHRRDLREVRLRGVLQPTPGTVRRPPSKTSPPR